MAKPAKFQRDEVIHNAMLLYWEKGFHATSMRTLQDAIDMRPGSIYAEFGSKEGLYQVTLEHYAEQSVQRLTETVTNAASPLLGLKQFVSDIVVPTDQPTPSNMCMLAKTVAELTEENSELLDSARKGLRRIEGEFANVIKAAQDSGEIDPSRDAQRIGQYVQIQIMGIRTYVRANQCDTHQTKALVDDIFALFI
ncbi:TetR family transcriptional regulator [Vibrio sp. 10N.286.49.C2]|uniref:TetR/AcrR family transcriptional regulator n=1 Tax=unclassified Vibrio TaxID=2614977 RepID=UPI000C81EB8E|nr:MULTISPECIES: TetR/AcrR family transcriptional regulator [unclassified Vibrio]PMH35150.1 TetR family transcriptional regulator [Vibrio sp. 10N.286.49.C2]PMH57094.1 TetR family transcriptional regulator [Vibrio sp. 10N.286.49.B1]PMH77899.1 TetR family transcriptional regulator [Vibrio sp. 10N.286.48.B7]